MSTISWVTALAYLVAATGFVVGLHLMNSPATARRGSRLSSWGMAVAVLVTIARIADDGTITATGWAVLAAGTVVGAAVGLRSADAVKMTAIPQLVSIFNAVGGGAAALVAVADFVRSTGAGAPVIPTSTIVPTVLDVVIGAVTFTGSLLAAGKLQGWVPGRPLVFPGVRVVNVVIAVLVLGAGAYLFSGSDSGWALVVVALAALAFGVTMVMPIGGADMPVVISMLNAFTGTAVAMAGFVLDSTALIIAGALVGASGAILTKLMADAMNRSIANIIVGGFGTGDGDAASLTAVGGDVHQISIDDAAIQLAYARKVIIVPGYGLAAAQAQHEVAQLAAQLEERGAEVSFAIHPVAGRMPGHMNVLLAEANVPYTALKEMDEINPEFPQTDVALVIGANDVTNPAARRPGTAISGMPILDVDKSRHVIVMKRSLGHGYAGIDNELYTDPNTDMCLADAKAGLAALQAAIKSLVG